jgi:RimJ/RimL family protein N-acetyltransferase
MIRLEKFEQRDYTQLISWADTAEALMQFAGPDFSFPLTPDQLDKSLRDSNRRSYKVVEESSSTTIGHAGLYLTNQSVFLGRILIGDEQQRGKGIGQSIVHLLLEMAFQELSYTKAELNVFDWNQAAIRCYEKAGFEINENKKSVRNVNGKTWVTLNMYLDKDKWRP